MVSSNWKFYDCTGQRRNALKKSLLDCARSMRADGRSATELSYETLIDICWILNSAPTRFRVGKYFFFFESEEIALCVDVRLGNHFVIVNKKLILFIDKKIAYNSIRVQTCRFPEKPIKWSVFQNRFYALFLIFEQSSITLSWQKFWKCTRFLESTHEKMLKFHFFSIFFRNNRVSPFFFLE